MPPKAIKTISLGIAYIKSQGRTRWPTPGTRTFDEFDGRLHTVSAVSASPPVLQHGALVMVATMVY